jgi:tetratricopeptide (TPR) repeat protein
MAKKPADRFRSMEELAAALAGFLQSGNTTSLGLAARSEGPTRVLENQPERTTRVLDQGAFPGRPRRRKLIPWAALVLLLAVVGGGTLAYLNDLPPFGGSDEKIQEGPGKKPLPVVGPGQAEGKKPAVLDPKPPDNKEKQPPASEDPQARTLYEEGVAFADQKKYAQAVAKFTAALKRNPKLAEAYCDRAAVYFRQSEYGKVVEDCTEAVKLQPVKKWLAQAHCYRAGAYNRLGEFSRALEDCKQALDFQPNLALAYAIRGDVYGNKADCHKAIKDCTRAIELDSKLALAYAYRSDAHGDLDELPQAIKDCDKALELDPLLGLAHAYRGVHYARKGERQKAQKAFALAVELAPNDAEVYNSRGVATTAGKSLQPQDLQAALDDFKKAIELAPGFPEFYTNRGRVWLLKQDVKQALADAEEAIRLNDRVPMAYLLRADVHLLEGNPGLAEADCKTALGINANLLSGYLTLGRAYRDQNKFPDAEGSLKKASELAPQSSQVLSELSMVYNYQKMYDKAITSCNTALNLDDENADAYFARGWALLRQFKWDDSLKDLTDALKHK